MRPRCRCLDHAAADFDPSCRNATGQAWDPTRGVQSTDADRHRFSRTGYGPQ